MKKNADFPCQLILFPARKNFFPTANDSSQDIILQQLTKAHLFVVYFIEKEYSKTVSFLHFFLDFPLILWYKLSICTCTNVPIPY